MTRSDGSLLFALILALAGTLAHADGDYLSPTDDRFRLSLGIIRVTPSTSLRVDSAAGLAGTDLNGESDLGLDSSDLEPKFQATVRAGERNRLMFDYFGLDRNDAKTLAQGPVYFGNVVLQAGYPVQTDASLRIFGIAYAYSFWHSETLELAATVGVHVTQISASVRVQTASTNIYDAENVAGPFPTVGLDGTWVASKRFYFEARGQYLNVTIDHIDGSLGLFEFDALYRFRPHVSFGVGYNSVRAHLNSRQSSDTGLFTFDNAGPEAFVRVAF
jgi:hypothetical protein